MRRTVCTARRATLKIPARTLTGSFLRAAADQPTTACDRVLAVFNAPADENVPVSAVTGTSVCDYRDLSGINNV